MLRTIKSILRWSFGAEAVLLLLNIGSRIGDSLRGHQKPPDPTEWAVYGGGIAISLTLLTAWRATRKPRIKPAKPALAACILNVAMALFLLRHAEPYSTGFFAAVALLVALNLAGLVLFYRNEN